MLWLPAMLIASKSESSACGVGFVASRHSQASHAVVQATLNAVRCVEHRGGVSPDGITGDGCGVMLDIPFELLGCERGEVAVATLFILAPTHKRRKAMTIFEETFAAMGLVVMDYRQVPICQDVLGPVAAESMPTIVHAFIRWPSCCRTEASFNRQLYLARQRVRTTMKEGGISQQFFFASLSTSTIVYKALTRAEDLGRLYPDLTNVAFKSRFGVFHRRFSTNTRTSWDKVQPFRLIAHNGEINTIAGNQSSAYSREQAFGLRPDELLTHDNVSDSGALNGMVEALKYRSSMPHTEDVLAIMVPPAKRTNGYYQFWGRAMEAWDGPAFISYCDGETIGARLDRNGFRPCRWAMTPDYFYLASEAGVFDLDERQVVAKGALRAGSGVRFDLRRGEAQFRDPSLSRENEGAHFDARLSPIPDRAEHHEPWAWAKMKLFLLTKEELTKVVLPTIQRGKEPIGSMGDTARIAMLSNEPRSFFDYFYQTFAQVTNPPLDYLRERLVTDLSVQIGKQPNIVAPKELLPPMPALGLDSPVLTLGQYHHLRQVAVDGDAPLGQATTELHVHFDREAGAVGFRDRLSALATRAIEAVDGGARILLLTDRLASVDQPPIPILLALRAVVQALNREGVRLECSVVVASGQVCSSHHLAALVGFGASAVCPVLPLEVAAEYRHRALDAMSAEDKQRNVIGALEDGLLKIMSKMGISVLRSYRSAKLFCAVGLGEEIIGGYFKGLTSVVGGLGLNRLAELVLANTADAATDAGAVLPSSFQFKEHAKLVRGEKHSMTALRSQVVHQMVQLDPSSTDGLDKYQEYLELGRQDSPLNIRHLVTLRGESGCSVDAVEPATAIMRRFGAGAMSFGAISAESQRDVIIAMAQVGGRSNSGEGGENPYYAIDGTSASTKQVASGRFGVTAQYLAAAEEIEIKMAQGAKPGEGGQLMGAKVDDAIARARHSMAGVDLISPPPMHDIYSIEDLKQLIFELKQLHPGKPVAVKLVAGVNIGTIAAGVVKAGADIVQVSGGDGGTGAASLMSMKHAGLPWELGLNEVHRTLCEQNLRSHVRLRVDGGLCTGEDVVMAAAFGADEVGFGKLLLVAAGCVMARVCEKNNCPRGIATHDPKYKAKYIGNPQRIVHLLTYLAEDVRRCLARIGVRQLDDVVGKTSYLMPEPKHEMMMVDRGIDLSRLLAPSGEASSNDAVSFSGDTSALNQRIVDDVMVATATVGTLEYPIRSVDRAVLARLSGELAERRHQAHLAGLTDVDGPGDDGLGKPVAIQFEGSAGQGFAVFLVDGIDALLVGEANDSVCKSMSGGMVTIVPHRQARLDAETSAIIGNCALYGATGGKLFVRGMAGDRFAVRNSGATAVVEGVGLHACGYMTAGTVVILGQMSDNVGSGMTGGVLYCRRHNVDLLNPEFVVAADLDGRDLDDLHALVEEYRDRTGSPTVPQEARQWLASQFVRCVSRREPSATLPVVGASSA